MIRKIRSNGFETLQIMYKNTGRLVLRCHGEVKRCKKMSWECWGVGVRGVEVA